MVLYRIKLGHVIPKYSSVTKRKKALDKVKEELITSKLIITRDWYLEKIQELETQLKKGD